jgi:hypothetical protein
MNEHDLDSLRLLTNQQHEQRLHEAGTERLASRGRRKPHRRRRPLLRIKLIGSVIASLDRSVEDAAANSRQGAGSAASRWK